MLSWLVLFKSTTANKIYSEHTRDYAKLFPLCYVEILQVTVNKLKFYYLFRLISEAFQPRQRISNIYIYLYVSDKSVYTGFELLSGSLNTILKPVDNITCFLTTVYFCFLPD